MEDYKIVALEAEVTFRQIKALNKQLLAAKTSADKRLIEAAIDKAKTDWFARVRQNLTHE